MRHAVFGQQTTETDRGRFREWVEESVAQAMWAP